MSRYQNVTILQAPAYDAAAYPYAVGEFCYREGEQNWFAVRLSYASAPFRFSGDDRCVINREGQRARQQFVPENNAWSGEEAMDRAAILTPGLSGGVFRRVWTNHDIRDQNGLVWLAAGCVTGAEWSGLKDWITGLSAGLTGKPLGVLEGVL